MKKLMILRKGWLQTRKLEYAFQFVVEDVAHLEDFDDLQTVVENSETLVKRNNLKLRGLKEQADGENLSPYLQDLFTSCIGSDSYVDISLIAA